MKLCSYRAAEGLVRWSSAYLSLWLAE